MSHRRPPRAVAPFATVALSLLVQVLAPTIAVGPVARAWGGTQAAPPAVNLELILDASGSMAAPTTTGETRAEAARAVLTEVVAAIPDDRENVAVGFRVFGHRGDNTDAGKAASCAASELRVPLGPVTDPRLRAEIAAFVPVGWTPIALALADAANDFPAADGATNVVILVTDGEETCGGDPCAAATALHRAGIGVGVNVVGFGTTDAEQANLACIAENGGGALFAAADAAELGAAIYRVLEPLAVVPAPATPTRGPAAPTGTPDGSTAGTCLGLQPGQEDADPPSDYDRVVLGTDGDDDLTGGPDADLICGFGGDDTMAGDAGDDRLDGGDGADRLAGGRGDDRLNGGAGADLLAGDAGDDRHDGGAGNDRCDTGAPPAVGDDDYDDCETQPVQE